VLLAGGLLVLVVLIGALYLTGLGLLYARDANYFGGPQRKCFYLNLRGVSQRQVIRFGPDADPPGCPFFAVVTNSAN
jgi:hypothetical protein